MGPAGFLQQFLEVGMLGQPSVMPAVLQKGHSVHPPQQWLGCPLYCGQYRFQKSLLIESVKMGSCLLSVSLILEQEPIPGIHWQGRASECRLRRRNCFSPCQRVCISSAKLWRRTAGTARGWFSRRRSLRSSLASGKTPSGCFLNGRSCLSPSWVCTPFFPP